jgi:serine/threonine protein kinase HipA of HipAB toxin-antitoxin module/DNA-binding transcriptional ArsR family regulator
MTNYSESIRRQLSGRPFSARQLAEYMGVSQPTISRALTELGNEIIRFGAARSIQYALRDVLRKLPDIPIYRVDVDGRIKLLGTLIPVRPEGFVMRQEDEVALHSDSLPWWLLDMFPQGFLGRAYAARHSVELGLPSRLADWNDTHALMGLLAHGYDMVGNLLVGENARDRFLAAPTQTPLAGSQKNDGYVRLAMEAARGEMPGSSAGGEQPKFTTYAFTPHGPRHVIVKFSEPEESLVSERWRDLLLAEHLALETLRAANFPAASTHIIDYEGHRFLEIERFDRVGIQGRRALFSLTSLDAEFAGSGTGDWPSIVKILSKGAHVHQGAMDGANLLWAYGTLIGNSDMHNGNLSFVSEHGRPYNLAPAYDMTPMSFSPRSGGGLRDMITEATIHSSVPNETWQHAEDLARFFLARIEAEDRFSRRFEPCIVALRQHIELASVKIKKLG